MQVPSGHGDGIECAHNDLVSFLWSACKSASPDKLALVDSRTHARISYSELRRSVTALASGLASLGIQQRDVVMIVMANCLEFPIICLGAMAIGAIVTTANPLNSVKEIQRQVMDSGARIVFTMSKLAVKLQDLDLPMVLCGDGVEPGFGFVTYTRLLEVRPLRFPEVSLQLSDTAAVLYSSGTTGVSKGVVLSHGNLVASQKIISKAREKQGVHKNEVVLGLLPFFHIAGLVFEFLMSIHNGTTLVVVEKFDLVEVWQTIERYRVSFMPCVPPVAIAFTKNHSQNRRYDLSSLSYVACGAAPLGKETQEAFLRLYPQVKRFYQAFGMTETTAVGFGLSDDDVCGSSGKAMPHFEVKVVEVGTGKSLPANCEGELCLRGPSIMQGYLNNAKATSETIDKDEWLHTGDLVYLDTNGNMFVMDRLKELIKYKGFQVPPAELEALLLGHPSIKDCAVVPFPDEEAGEIPFAYIVRGENSMLSEADVIKFVSDQVAPHKRVRKVAFVEAIPKSATGKLLRKELKNLSRPRL